MYSSLISIAKKLSSHEHLKQLHAQMILNSLHQNSFWVSLLITKCTRLNAPSSYTNLVFNFVQYPTVSLYNCMLRYLSHLGAHHEVTALFQKMLRAEVRPDAFVYPILIKSAEKSGIALHAHIFKLGYICDRILSNGIMAMYAKHGPIEVARQLFDEMSDRAVADWNSMISGCWRWGLEIEALRLFDVMPQRNVITWTCMVTGFSRIKNLERARWYFDVMPQKSVVSWNAMLSGYAQNGFKDEAFKLFNEMLDAGVHPDDRTWTIIISSSSSHGDASLVELLVGMLDAKKVHVNPFIQTALLDMSAKCGKLEAARDIFDELGTHANTAARNAMISAYARVGDLTSARDLFGQMPERDIVSWNSMIAGYAQNGQSPQAIELFKQLIEVGHPKPDEVTMVSALSACGHLGALELGNWVVDFLSKADIKLSISGYNSMIFMYSKCGSMKDAMRIFKEINLRDVVSYNTIIAALAAHGDASEAIKLVSKMGKEGIKPDRLTFIGVLTACSHAGLIQEGRKVFESINCPSVDHYACMIDLLGRAGELDEALRLLENMPMEPHAGVYGSLLNAGRIHRRVELGELAAKKLFELEPNNSGNYVLLSNVYAAASRWKDVERVREYMKQKGVVKATGWSLAEYDGKIHKFIAGDRSHERSKEIFGFLSKLRQKMRQSGYFADKDCVLSDIEEEDKEEMVGVHSEKLAISFALLVSKPGSVIRVVKNLRIFRILGTSNGTIWPAYDEGMVYPYLKDKTTKC
ncbi:hypothetical protein Cgig2_018177 [Carnegiea gigantea]|uniref:DYW domain-containing protein n=1 Tax=Carnegiea gigantea TaxID=171969 RepID=A0A9Q1QQH8_9CARY|nr:hypothetical protein Cgig2_018177 [Carnegiea gigantea]